MDRLTFLLLGACAAAIGAPAQAQEKPAAAKGSDSRSEAQIDDDPSTIVVNGQRPEGSVPGDVVPEVTYSPADIRSFGVSSISDLLSELAPQLSSTQGRGGESPVVLLAGKRISSFAEIRDIPTEAIQRVEILPEEVALQYGYRPNQKVVNVVLRHRFKAITAEAGAGMPTAGGQFSPSADGSFFRIRSGGRLNLALNYNHSSALYEDERDILPTPYNALGNVVAPRFAGDPEIDPALSALLGRTATEVGVPASAASGIPTLADFAAATLVPGPDIRHYRTLLPQTDAVTFNAVLAKTIFGSVSATFNGTLSYNESDSAQGLATAAIGLPAGNPYSPFANDTVIERNLSEFGALGQQSRNYSGHLGTTLNGSLGKWLWSFTGTFDRTVARTKTDRGFDLSGFQADIDALDPLVNPFAPLTSAMVTATLTDWARSATDVTDAQLVLSGSLFRLPAGAITTSLKLGATMSDFSSSAIRAGLDTSSDLSRDDVSGQISIDVPIASRKKGVLSPLGELSANFNAAYEHLSDFGGLRTLGFGLHWAPVRVLTFIASFNEDEGAPTVQQLGAPPIATSGVQVFDYIKGETVDITRLSGGNPGLRSDDRRVFKLAATLKPLANSDLSIIANFTKIRDRNPIATFPTATAAIEAAFPGRFTRDTDGTLLQIDGRPINFARQDQEEFRWGINFSKQLSTPPRPAGGFGGPEREGQRQLNLRSLLPPGQPAAAQGGGPGAEPQPGAADGEHQGQGDGGARGGGFRGGAGGGGGGRGGGGGQGGRGTRLQLAIYHTVHLRQSVLIYENGPSLDLLNGDAIGSSGGQPRHEVQAQAGLTHNGLGARISANWQSATTVNGGIGGSQMLHFSDLATINLRLFANLGQQQALVTKWHFLRGSRLTIGINNLFDAHQDVRDAAGDTPIGYQADYLNPLGRSLKITFRKQFF